MDVLRLKGLKFRGLHGFYDEERQKGNDFEVDLTFHQSLQKAAESDNLEDTLDYQKAYEAVKNVMEGPSVKLIEHLAFLIGQNILEHLDSNSKFDITVRKLNPPLPTEIDFSEVTLSWPR